MEWLDIVDETGAPTGEIIEREQAHAHGVRHRTSHVWISRRHEGQVQILLQKRSLNKDSHPGEYDISSAGHIPAGVDFIPSALRELQEELGVSVSADQLIFCGQRHFTFDSVFHGKPFHDNQISNIYLLWLNREESNFTIQKSEISSIRWMNFTDCLYGVEHNIFPHCIYPEELRMISRYFNP